jgi:serine/threonine protein kinase
MGKRMILKISLSDDSLSDVQLCFNASSQEQFLTKSGSRIQQEANVYQRCFPQRIQNWDGYDLELKFQRSLNLAQVQFDPQDLPALMLDVLQDLKKIHHMGLLHLDLKPQNIVIQANGEASLIDFGFSQSIGFSYQTKPAASLAYAAPEQIACEAMQVNTDIYALGCVLYFTLTQKVYQSGDSLEALPVIWTKLLHRMLTLDSNLRADLEEVEEHLELMPMQRPDLTAACEAYFMDMFLSKWKQNHQRIEWAQWAFHEFPENETALRMLKNSVKPKTSPLFWMWLFIPLAIITLVLFWPNSATQASKEKTLYEAIQKERQGRDFGDNIGTKLVSPTTRKIPVPTKCKKLWLNGAPMLLDKLFLANGSHNVKCLTVKDSLFFYSVQVSDKKVFWKTNEVRSQK